MTGSNLVRLARLAGSLLRRPQDIGPYVTFAPLWGRRPVDVELPWMSFGAVRYLERFLRPDHFVFEFGSGGSSFFLARRVASVLSVENDPAWHQRVTELATARGFTNLHCEYHALQLDRPETYEEQGYFLALQPRPYDVIIVDGYLDYENGRYGRLRHVAFERALRCVRRPGGIIVVDDYWMLRELAARAPEARVTEFVSTGPCRYGVTSTAVFEF